MLQTLLEGNVGNSTRPVAKWEVLQVAGITVSPAGKGLLVEMTVDGAARLAQSLSRVRAGKPDTSLVDMFLELLVQVGKQARLEQERS